MANSPSPVPTQPNSPSPPAPAQLAQGEPSFNSVASFLPATIWETPFVATRPAAEMVVRAQQLPDYAYSRACEGSGFQSLTVRAPTIQECVDLYDRKLTEAAIANDYTEIMAVQRRFQIDGQPGTPSSVGEGIEREVTWLLFQKYANEQQAAWFAPRLGEGCSPQIAYPFVSESRIPDSRIIGMKKLGAACALLMIQGLTPHPMDPTVFQFIIHGCNLHSLTPGFVGEWHPEFKNELAQFLSLGPQDDISRFEYLFISYLNSSIAPYRHRDESSHKAIGSLILYNALFGSIPPNHPEWKAFREGVTLRCPRGRFTFPQLVRSFEGGSDQFLSLTWSTSVRYDSLAQMITFDTGSYPEMLGTLQLADPSYTFNGLFLEFLQGTGVPCPGLFDEVKASFSPLVDLSGISSADFRSRMFVWAATGHPFLDNEDRDVHVIVRRAPPMMLNDRQRTVFQAGNLLFQTCSKRVTIYGPHIIKLLTDTYPPSGATEPASFKEAFSFWLLVQVLNAIGRHSIL
ncbi:hypothetical protein NMY22_g16775 [Coprinellus aureogranulatus]|nr:hypothetical protein NMY22_g16775 [Coprinellus aureogranulatus]